MNVNMNLMEADFYLISTVYMKQTYYIHISITDKSVY